MKSIYFRLAPTFTIIAGNPFRGSQQSVWAAVIYQKNSTLVGYLATCSAKPLIFLNKISFYYIYQPLAHHNTRVTQKKNPATLSDDGDF